MTPRSNVFVSNPELLTKIKNEDLHNCMKIGSCIRTPLERKTTFNYSWASTEYGDRVISVTCYQPNSSIPGKTFMVDIALSDWYRITSSVSNFDEWQEEVIEKDHIRSVIKTFEEAAKIHGARQTTVANGFISDPEPFLRESGKILKDARAALYEELDA